MPHTTGGSYRSRPGHANPRMMRAIKARRGAGTSTIRKVGQLQKRPRPLGRAFGKARRTRGASSGSSTGTRSAYFKRSR